MEIIFVPVSEINRINESKLSKFDKLQLISDVCRLNTLSAVKRAGSGHLGSSMSAMDICVLLYFSEMNILSEGITSPGRDIYFSSKGHDCPGQYSIMTAAGIIPFEKLLKLRKLGGLDGHPDIKIPGIEANSGSLGMGISKAKGMAVAKKLSGHGGRVFVLTGDGELQEGQIWESLQTASFQNVTNINVIVDFNKIQSDKPVEEIIGLGDIERKFEVFGWYVERCDGHNFEQLQNVFNRFKSVNDRPKVLIADTIKGKGVSFMEGPNSLRDNNGVYKWHSGAPEDDYYEAGRDELIQKINDKLDASGLKPLSSQVFEIREKNRVSLKSVAEKVVTAFGDALVEAGERRSDLIVIDADLSADCGLRQFENRFPERFIENGIAEQDMVSMAGGLALHGYLPVVNSFGVFLASRANEQIYANATEGTKIIYACHFSGLIPAGPGKSHQSMRDISLFGALPNCVIIEPSCPAEVKQAVDWCVDESKENCMMRLAISPSPRKIDLPDNYRLTFAAGTVLKPGTNAVLFAYGPVMLNEALCASEILENQSICVKVINMPWLNRIDRNWLVDVIGDINHVFVIDNHDRFGALGDFMLNTIIATPSLRNKKFTKFAVEEYPACGTPQEVLKYHRLDGESLAERIKSIVAETVINV